MPEEEPLKIMAAMQETVKHPRHGRKIQMLIAAEEMPLRAMLFITRNLQLKTFLSPE